MQVGVLGITTFPTFVETWLMEKPTYLERHKVNSSNIVSIGHDTKKKILQVEFKNGNVYEYRNVPEDVYLDLMGAESVGSYFNANIRMDYPYSKL